MTEIPNKVLKVLRQRYHLLDHLSFLDFDHDFDILRRRLSRCSKANYKANEKILIEHLDTDFYLQECKVGINLRNFFGIVEAMDISPSVIIIYTNHFGITREIDLLCSNFHHSDRPVVIESFLSQLHNNPSAIEQPAHFDRIQFHGLCMMHMKRSHRHAMFNAVKSIDPSRLILSATLPNDKF